MGLQVVVLPLVVMADAIWVPVALAMAAAPRLAKSATMRFASAISWSGELAQSQG